MSSSLKTDLCVVPDVSHRLTVASVALAESIGCPDGDKPGAAVLHETGVPVVSLESRLHIATALDTGDVPTVSPDAIGRHTRNSGNNIRIDDLALCNFSRLKPDLCGSSSAPAWHIGGRHSEIVVWSIHAIRIFAGCKINQTNCARVSSLIFSIAILVLSVKEHSVLFIRADTLTDTERQAYRQASKFI